MSAYSPFGRDLFEGLFYCFDQIEVKFYYFRHDVTLQQGPFWGVGHAFNAWGGGGRGGSLHVKSLDKCDFSDFDPQNRRSPRKLYQTT